MSRPRPFPPRFLQCSLAIVGLLCQVTSAPCQDRLFATATGFGIIEVDPLTGLVINSFDTPENSGVGDGLAYDGDYLYYLHAGVDPKVYALQPDSGVVVDTIALPNTGFNMYGQGIAHLNGQLYVLDWSAVNQDIVVYDLGLGEFTATLDFDGMNPEAPIIGGALGAITGPDALLLSSFQGGVTSIFQLDPLSGEIIHEFDWGVRSALGLTSLGEHILVGDHVPPGLPFHDHVLLYDRSGKRVDSISIQTGDRRVVIGVQSLAGSGEAGMPTRLGDFNDDGLLTAEDLNLLSSAVRVGSDLSFDLNRDQRLDREDRRIWIEDLKRTIVGDIDLDGQVQFSDFLRLSNFFGQLGGWEHGDLDGNGDVGFADFLLLSETFGEVAPPPLAIPEPSAALLLVWGFAALDLCRRRSRQR